MPKQRIQKKETAAQSWTKFSDALKKVCAHLKKDRSIFQEKILENQQDLETLLEVVRPAAPTPPSSIELGEGISSFYSPPPYTMESIQEGLQKIKQDDGFVEACRRRHNDIINNSIQSPNDEILGKSSNAITLAQRILHWLDQYQIISPYKSEFDFNFMRNCSMFFHLYNQVKRTSLEVEAWFVEGFRMNPENIRYWFKMGVRVNTLYRIINELAFYINDFIPVDFIQEATDSEWGFVIVELERMDETLKNRYKSIEFILEDIDMSDF